MELEAEKQALRARMRARRRKLPAGASARVGSAVAEAICATPEFRNAGKLGLYAALPDEVCTRMLFQAALESGKRVCAPRLGANGALDFAAFDAWEDLRPGSFRALEPAPEAPVCTLHARDLVIVPGVAFDDCGRRLGRGVACYDRTFPPELSDCPVLFGLAFWVQVVARVPAGCHDRQMDAVCTERGVLRGQSARYLQDLLRGMEGAGLLDSSRGDWRRGRGYCCPGNPRLPIARSCCCRAARA